MKRTALIPSLLCLITLLLSGCASVTPSFETPKVTLADIKVEEIRPLEAAFLIQLRVMNPNDLSLTVKGLTCELELDGSEFASGMQGENQEIPAYGSALVPVKVYASVFGVVTSVIGRIQAANKPGSGQDPLTYGLKGKVKVSSKGISKELPFTSTGELTLQ